MNENMKKMDERGTAKLVQEISSKYGISISRVREFLAEKKEKKNGKK